VAINTASNASSIIATKITLQNLMSLCLTSSIDWVVPSTSCSIIYFATSIIAIATIIRLIELIMFFHKSSTCDRSMKNNLYIAIQQISNPDAISTKEM